MSGVNPGKTISHDEINALPLKAFMGEILLITKAAQLPEVFAEIQKHSVVGFDTETKPAFVKGQVFKVALLQLAIPGKVFLIRLNMTGVTKDIIHFLKTKTVSKQALVFAMTLKSSIG